jgi:hypothetical protein
MRAKEGFFPNMFRLVQHEDEIVSGMACQVCIVEWTVQSDILM